MSPQLSLGIEATSSGTLTLSLNFGTGSPSSVISTSSQEIASRISSIINQLPPNEAIRILVEEGEDSLLARIEELGIPQEISDLMPGITSSASFLTREPGRGEDLRVQATISIDMFDLTLEEASEVPIAISPDFRVTGTLRLEFR